MNLIYRAIKWWPGAYHVFDGDKRIGIVNQRIVRSVDQERVIWLAHNEHFFSIKGEFSTRTDAARAIPKGPIHHGSSAISGITL